MQNALDCTGRVVDNFDANSTGAAVRERYIDAGGDARGLERFCCLRLGPDARPARYGGVDLVMAPLPPGKSDMTRLFMLWRKASTQMRKPVSGPVTVPADSTERMRPTA